MEELCFAGEEKACVPFQMGGYDPHLARALERADLVCAGLLASMGSSSVSRRGGFRTRPDASMGSCPKIEIVHKKSQERG